MRNQGKNSTSLLTVILLAMTLVAAGVWWRAWGQAGRVRQARASLAECQLVAAQLEAIQRPSRGAEVLDHPKQDLAEQIEAWCRSAGVESQNILSIEPTAPRRQGESSYVEHGARVELRRVTLPQLAAFAETIEAADSRLVVDQLRLTAPRTATEQPEEPWRAEFGLTYLVYSPKSERRR